MLYDIRMKLLMIILIQAVSSAFALEIHHEFTTVAGVKMEYFWAATPGNNKPVMLYLHPHNEIGSAAFVTNGLMKLSAEQGYLAVAISLPGYGESLGVRDFSGPQSQKLVREVVVNCIKRHHQANASKLILYGVGNGAIIASMMATTEERFEALILVSGLYDLEYSMDQFEGRAAYDNEVALLLRRIKLEIGSSDERFYLRSALLHVDRIKTPTLVINGEKDTQTFPEQARELVHLLRANRVNAKSIIRSGERHDIPLMQLWPDVTSFLESL